MTLIEVMVAVTIITMMVAGVWASFRGTIRGMKATEEIQTRYGMIRNAMGTMSREMSMAYLSFNRPSSETKHYTLFEGRDGFDADSLTFSAFAHLRIRKDANESDQSVIQYFLAKDPKDSSRTHLYRRETRRLTGDLPERLENYYPRMCSAKTSKRSILSTGTFARSSGSRSGGRRKKICTPIGSRSA